MWVLVLKRIFLDEGDEGTPVIRKRILGKWGPSQKEEETLALGPWFTRILKNRDRYAQQPRIGLGISDPVNSNAVLKMGLRQTCTYPHHAGVDFGLVGSRTQRA